MFYGYDIGWELKTQMHPTTQSLLLWLYLRLSCFLGGEKNWMGNQNLIERIGLDDLLSNGLFVGLAYQGKDIVFRFIIEYSSLMDFGP